MKKPSKILIPALLLLSSMAYAGAEMEMVTKGASGQEKGRAKIYAQSGMIRIDEMSAGESSGSMIFLGDRFLYLDHGEKRYVVMDEAMLDTMSSQVNAAMQEMQEQLHQVQAADALADVDVCAHVHPCPDVVVEHIGDAAQIDRTGDDTE